MGFNHPAATGNRDGNEAPIVKALRKIGRHVTLISGAGVPDLLVIRPSHDLPIHIVETVEQALDAAMADDLCLIEVKNTGGSLRPAQVKWHRETKP